MTMIDNEHCGTSILSASIYIWALVKEENSLYEQNLVHSNCHKFKKSRYLWSLFHIENIKNKK